MPGDDVEHTPPLASGPRPGRATATDVAALAGTSVSTVSLVASGKTKGRVSSSTIARVASAIETLGYVVDHTASALARGSADVVILVAPDLSNPYYGDVVRGIMSVLGDRYQLLLSVASPGVQPDASVVGRLTALRPAGLLIDAPSAEFLAALPAGPATVLLDAPGSARGDAIVNYDLVRGTDDLVDHLADQGHRVLAYLDSSTGTETFALRRSLIEAAAARRGLTLLGGVASVVDVSAAAAAVTAAWPEWRASGATAVLCATDTQAYGALASARLHEIRVPEDVAVSGFDDLPSSVVTAPGLTSVALPGTSLGRTAASRMLELLGAAAPPPANAAADDDDDDLTTRLVIRDSTRHVVS
ncbi:LacI family transcriptional regulator [Frondihabitans sucicola]|uniref:LacI family transcriptional regulator n=1 Tax=Frondihabitans sucicola TaxID=1268041 RepID=A0ABM8GMH6_9MICO|nr:LacI family DNA-binding transcriptional regulator [Frondihabitans sucicola]BDZ49409.1 LacI family transcriptional regulator [Frondihabitans sucicola]